MLLLMEVHTSDRVRDCQRRVPRSAPPLSMAWRSVLPERQV